MHIICISNVGPLDQVSKPSLAGYHSLFPSYCYSHNAILTPHTNKTNNKYMSPQHKSNNNQRVFSHKSTPPIHYTTNALHHQYITPPIHYIRQNSQKLSYGTNSFTGPS